MKILALDTSSTACSVALLVNEKIIHHHEISPMQQAKRILPIIQELLTAENVSLNQLDAIAFGCGPGSFTGVRIATSVAQGLAYATLKPLIPVSSLAAIAQATYEEKGWNKLLVAIDARINEVYWASYEAQEKEVCLLGKERVSTPDQVQALDQNSWYGIGNAWEVYNAEITYKPLQIDTSRLPMATGIISLAKKSLLRGETVAPQEALPVYLRDDVAKKIPDQ